MDTATLSSKGQFVIPKAVHDVAHIATGTRPETRHVDGEIQLRPLLSAPPRPWRKWRVAFIFKRQALSEADAQAAIRAKLKARDSS